MRQILMACGERNPSCLSIICRVVHFSIADRDYYLLLSPLTVSMHQLGARIINGRLFSPGVPSETPSHDDAAKDPAGGRVKEGLP